MTYMKNLYVNINSKEEFFVPWKVLSIFGQSFKWEKYVYRDIHSSMDN